MCYHVFNRGNAQAEVFRTQDDYTSFLKLLARASGRVPMRLLAYCLMPDHFHLVVWTFEDGDLGRWMQWLLTSHVRRYHRQYGSTGRVWQGRFKAFPTQDDEHLLTVLRYVERNPIRSATLDVREAQDWPWSSIGIGPPGVERPPLDAGPVPRGDTWLASVNAPQPEAELAALRESLQRSRPFGSPLWQQATANRLGLEHTLRPRGRPKKRSEK